MKQRIALWLLRLSIRRVTSIPLSLIYEMVEKIINDPSNPITEAQTVQMKQMLAIGEVIEPCLL